MLIFSNYSAAAGLEQIGGDISVGELGSALKDLRSMENFKYLDCVDGYTRASAMVLSNWVEERDWGIDLQMFPPGNSWKNDGPFRVVASLTAPKQLRRPSYVVMSALIDRLN